MKNVFISGIGLTQWGKYADKSVEDLALEAVNAALKDANICWKDVQYVIAAIDPFGGLPGLLAGPELERALGYTGIPATSLFSACASGSFTLDMGRSMVLSGLHDVVLCFGSFKAPGGFFPTLGNQDDPYNFDAQRFRLLGATNPTYFAMQAVRRMHNYSLTETDIAAVKVKNSKHGKLNPYARYQRDYTLEEVMASPMVSYPLRLLELAATSDGAAAVVITSEKFARKHSSKMVKLTACSGSQPKYPNMDIGLPPFIATQSEISTSTSLNGIERAHEKFVIQGALSEAGVSPKDLDFVECYDLSTAMELDWIEDIGICQPGEAESLMKKGETTIGGKIPVNPSGGVSAFGESVPAQSLLQVCEMVTQLRGNAGNRQVENAKVGLVVNKGLWNSISCMIAEA